MKALKRTIAAIMALVIVGGAAPVIPGGFTALKPITASAEEGSVTFDSATGTLTLSGAVTKAQIREYALKFVKSIVAKEGTILPADCCKLFEGFENSGNVSHVAFENVEYIDLSKANTSIVTNMDSMFRCMLKVKSINLSGWNTKRVTDMSEMFYGCPQLQEVNIVDFDTRNVVNMDSMFEGCEHLTTLDVSNFNTEKVKRMDKMFKKCLNIPSVDISSFNTISVTNMSEMFYGCGELVTIYASEGFTACDNSNSIFYGCSSLVGGAGTTYKYSNSTSEFARIDGGSSNPGYFTYKEFKDWRSLPFDESTGTLTLTGEIRKEQLDEYRNDSRVKHINTDGTAVLPEDCNHFFTEFTALEDVDFSTIDSTNVTDIGAMFSDCKNLVTVDLTGFNTNRVTSMYATFLKCSKLKTIYVNKYWDVSGTPAEGVNSVNMFYGCTSLVGGNGTTYDSHYTDNTYAYADQGASRPGYLTLVDENYLLNGTLYIMNFKTVDFDAFSGIKRIVALEGSEITNNGVKGLFNANSNPTLRTVTEIDLSKAAISNNIIYLNSMFSGCSSLKKVTFPADYTASNVTQMANMFRGCSALTTVNLSGFNTTSLQYTSNMFDGCSSLENIDLSGLKTSSVINMSGMFSNCTSLRSLGLSGLDTSNVKNMDNMFSSCSNLKYLNLAGFDTRNVTDMRYMFAYCSSLERIIVGDNWSTAKVTSSSAQAEMFRSCKSLIGGNGTVFDPNITNSSYARVDLPGTPGYFRKSCCFYDPETNTLTLSGLIDKDEVFEYSGERIHNARAVYIVADETAILPENCENLFSGLLYTKHIDLSKADPSNVKVVRCMFEGSGAEDIQLPDNLVTNKVTDLSGMFKDCEKLESIDVSDFDTSNVTKMNSMFELCRELTTLDLSNFDTSKVTDMNNMFECCASLTELDVSNFDTSKVTNMAFMFGECWDLKTLDLSNFDTSNVTDMNNMFAFCNNMTSLNLITFDTSKVKNMKAMFLACKSLVSIDLSSFDTSQNVEIDEMFNYCFDLETILVSDKWEPYAVSTSGPPEYDYVFFYCGNLKGGNGTTYSDYRAIVDYARIDKAGGPGYFTENTLYNIAFNHNCSFQNDLSMYYAVPKESLSGFENIRLDVSKEEYAAGATKPTFAKKTLTSYKEQTINGVVYYVFTFDGITSTDMGSTLSAVLRADKNGVTYSSKPDKYSIKDYAMDRLQNSNNSSFKKMLVDMLNYGAAAQLHFDKNVTHLANSDLTTPQRKMGTQTLPTLKNAEKSTAVSGATATFDKKNVSFENKTVLMYRLKFVANQNMDNVKLTITYKTSSGASVTKTIPASQFAKSGSYYIASIDSIAITDVRSVITAKIYDGSKQISNTFQYSIESYVYNRLQNSDSETFKNLVTEMMKFGISAEEHFS